MNLPIRKYRSIATDGAARRGEFSTAHGIFQTPNFMPVGTQGSVKGVDVERVREAGAQIMLVNTYHLALRPGETQVQALGGIQKFTGWSGPILSDSGGFQVFSLKSIRTLSEQGVEFRSHIDGRKIFLSPERSIEIQQTLGVDIAMAFDECPAYQHDHEAVAKSLAMTIRWASRCLAARTREDMSLFGITQGGIFRDLRTESAEAISALPFDGVAVGGLSVGEPKPEMYEVMSYHVAQLPVDKIRYVMGVGTPEDLVTGVKNGVDLFDCVMPTRAGRFGRAFINGPIPYVNIRNAENAGSTEPLDSTCQCIACRTYSRGYIHHLFKAREMLGPQLMSIHNLTHYLSLMKRIRDSIEAGTFGALYAEIKGRWRDVGDDPIAEEES